MLNKMERDVRKEWFMQQHYNTEELQQIYEWEQKSGTVGDVVPVEGGFCLHNISDTERKISLCFMKEEHELRRWTERLGYKTSDGKTAQQFEDENGIKDEPVVYGKEIYRERATSINWFEDKKKFEIVSGDYAIVTKRTASNSYEILMLTSEEYAKHLEETGIQTKEQRNKIDVK